MGKGVQKDLVAAFQWYQKSAENGDDRGQYNYALCLKNGVGVKANAVEAIEWFNKSAVQGNDNAMDMLGYCFHNGVGVEKNIIKAKEWYEKAAAKGNKNSIESLKRIEEESDNSLYRIKGHNGLWGYANAAGMVVIPCNWTYTKDFVDDVALVWKGKKMGAINRKGEYYFDCKINCQKATYLGHNLIKVYDVYCPEKH